jgi:hypothetical protein
VNFLRQGFRRENNEFREVFQGHLSDFGNPANVIGVNPRAEGPWGSTPGYAGLPR